MMWSKPADPGIALRMRTAHVHASSTLGVLTAEDAREAWGWRGRTLGKPVIAPDGPAWLRLACASVGQAVATFWDGSIEAEKFMPRSIPRPCLRTWHDWRDQHWQYRAELYDLVTSRPAVQPRPPRSWRLRPTCRGRGGPPFGPHWTRSPAFPPAASPSTRHSLTTPCHGCLARPSTLGPRVPGRRHTATFTSPTSACQLCTCSTSRAGVWPRPATTAATLHSYSLLVPAAAARVHSELAHILGTPAGRFAELAVITELLHAATQGGNAALTAPLRQRASLLLGRPIPSPHPESTRPGAGLSPN